MGFSAWVYWRRKKRKGLSNYAGEEKEKNQEEEEINLHGSASTQSLKAGGGAGPLPPRDAAVAVDGAPSERPKEQNKGNIFSTDGNRPY